MGQEALNREVRTARRTRTLGPNAYCSHCGCVDPTALVKRTRQGKRVILCYECAQARDGKRTVEDHHLLGKASDEVTIPVPGNAHRVLSDLQLDRSAALRDNPDRDPLIWLAQLCHALKDIFTYCVEWLDRIAEWLLALSQELRAQFGTGWWTALGVPPFWQQDKDAAEDKDGEGQRHDA
jgi:hypothetical protein